MPKTTHGAAKAHIKLYRVYRGMLSRCYREKCDMYPIYGGRGITVCDEWRESPMAFVTWALANGYQDNLQIDRRETDGNYEPGNCRFLSPREQQQNRRNNRVITHNGRSMCMEEWARETGIPSASIQVRLDRCGWTIERALTEMPKLRKLKYNVGGENLTITEIAQRAGISHSTVCRRLKTGTELLAPPTPPAQRRYA